MDLFGLYVIPVFLYRNRTNILQIRNCLKRIIYGIIKFNILYKTKSVISLLMACDQNRNWQEWYVLNSLFNTKWEVQF